MLTFRSVMRCRGPSRSTWSSRISALPYWARPSTTPAAPLSLPVIMPASLPACLGRGALAPSVHGVPVRRQQQGHVIVLAGLGGEGDGYLREERRPMVGHQVVPDREDQAAGRPAWRAGEAGRAGELGRGGEVEGGQGTGPAV